MSTILLNQSSLAQVIECVPGARFVFAFPTDAAELSRSADDLVISFADGGSITLNGFYETYTQQDMPTFEVGGDEVSGAEFFAELDQPDLMPAAGPEPAKDTHYQEWSNMDLLGGIDRLGGLEIGWPDGGIDIHDDGGVASGGDINHPIRITPADPVTSDVPIIDPSDPDTPLNTGPLFVVDDLRVHESALGDGNPSPEPGTLTASGAMLIDAPDGLRSIVITDMLGSEYTVYLDSSSNPDAAAGSILVEKIWVHGEGSEGYLHNFAYDGATGRFTYDFTLNDATQEHFQPGEDAIGHIFKVTVDDKDSDLSAEDSASSHILVTIVDDMPVLGLVEAEGTPIDRSTGLKAESGDIAIADEIANIRIALNDLDFGADMLGTPGVAGVKVEVNGSSYAFTATADASGNYSFVSDSSEVSISGDSSSGYVLTYTRPGGVADKQNESYEFKLTFVDADGDIVEGTEEVYAYAEPDLVPDPDQPGGTPDPDPDQPGGDPDPTPDPDPDNPPTDPEEPEVPGKDPEDPTVPSNEVLDALVTDDSYVDNAGGNKDNTGAVSDRDSGSFVLKLNGLSQTLIITGDSGEKLTLQFGISGQLISPADLSDASVGGSYGRLHSFSTSTDGSSVRVSYIYTQDTAYQHPADDNAHDAVDFAEFFGVTVRDSIGQQDEGAITVTIEDDGPVVSGLMASDDSVANEYSASLSGTFSADFGADGGHFQLGDDSGSVQGGVTTFTVGGGQLVITHQGGNTYGYEFKPANPDVSFAEKKFTITAVDGDGDTASTTITVSLNYVPDIIFSDPAATGDTIVVDEGALLPAGEQAGHHVGHGKGGTGSFSVDLHGENGVITVGGYTIRVTGENAAITGSSSIDAATGVSFSVSGVSRNSDGTWEVRYGYELTGASSSPEDLTGHIAIKVEDASGGIATDSISITVHDDKPYVNASVDSVILESDTANMPKMLADSSVVNFTTTTYEAADSIKVFGGQVEVSGGTTLDNGVQTPGTITTKNVKVVTSPHTASENKGLMVENSGKDRDPNEISANNDGKGSSECIIFDLGDNLAHGIAINFGAFYSNSGETEQAVVSFYRGNDSTPFYSTLYTSNTASGQWGATTGGGIGDYLSDGFDRVVITPLDKGNGAIGNNSDFTIQTVDFITLPQPVTIIKGNTGSVFATAAEGFADNYEHPVFGHANGETFTVNLGGTEATATLSITSGSTGSQMMTATAGSTQLFSAILEDDGSWSYNLFTDFTVVNSNGSPHFELKFESKDKGGDVGTASIFVDTNHSDGSAVLLYGDGADTVPGNPGDDAIYGGAGDDVFRGMDDGADALFGESGSDIFVYDSADALVHGGLGIDVLLSGDTDTHLNALLNDGKVQDVEVLVRGIRAVSLTSLDALADKGVTVGDDSVTLSNAWKDNGNGIFENTAEGLTIETTLEVNTAAEQIILQSNT